MTQVLQVKRVVQVPMREDHPYMDGGRDVRSLLLLDTRAVLKTHMKLLYIGKCSQGSEVGDNGE